MELFSPEYRMGEAHMVIPWKDYSEFWLCFPNITVEQQKLVTDEVPTLEGLVKLGKAKDFSNLLKTTGLSALKATAVSDLIHDSVYKNKANV